MIILSKKNKILKLGKMDKAIKLDEAVKVNDGVVKLNEAVKLDQTQVANEALKIDKANKVDDKNGYWYQKKCCFNDNNQNNRHVSIFTHPNIECMSVGVTKEFCCSILCQLFSDSLV